MTRRALDPLLVIYDAEFDRIIVISYQSADMLCIEWALTTRLGWFPQRWHSGTMEDQRVFFAGSQWEILHDDGAP